MNDPLRAQQMVRRQVRRRRLWRRLRIAGLTVLTTSVILAAAFGIDRLVIVAHRFYVEHHHPAKRVTGAVHHPVTTTSTTIAGPARCGSAQLSALVSDWRETGGAVIEKVELTNISAAPCSLNGYPVLGAGAQNGTPLPATTTDLATLAGPLSVSTTVASGPVSLAHGAVATFVLEYANDCDHVLGPGQPATGAPNECYDGLWLEVTPTPGSAPLIVTQPVRLTYATSGFEVGPFQAGSGSPLSGQPPLTAQTTTTTTTPITTSTTAPPLPGQ